MQVGIYYPSRVEYFVPPSGPEKQVIKGVTTAAYKKVAKGVLRHNRILQHVMKAISTVLRVELHRVATYFASVKPSHGDVFMTFTWSSLFEELKKRCPQLIRILTLVLPPRRRAQVYPCLCVVVAMLAKAKNKNAHLVQLLLSLVLLYGHSSSQVSEQTCTHIYTLMLLHLIYIIAYCYSLVWRMNDAMISACMYCHSNQYVRCMLLGSLHTYFWVLFFTSYMHAFTMQTHVRLQPLLLTVHRNTSLQVQHMLAVDYARRVLQWKHELESSLENAWIQVNSAAPCIVLHEL